MQAASESVWTSEPFREGTADEYTRTREMLVRNGYTGHRICERLGIGTMSDFRQFRAGRERMLQVDDPLSLLVRLLFDAERVPWTTVHSLLPAADIDALTALGLIRTSRADESACVSTVLVYPVEGLYLVSDRTADSTDLTPLPADLVYAAVTKNTYQFMSVFPRTPCDRFLELCAGTGVAALVAARDFARHAVASDITERSTRFARFNAALNALANVETVRGDLYDPVRGRVFDRIVAHPPYVPAAEQEYVFRDGGEDGEQITRRIIEGLPEFLAPGGRCYCLCLMTDRAGAPVEQRVRAMLGRDADQFDVLVGQGKGTEPTQFLINGVSAGVGSTTTIEPRLEAFERLGIERMVYGVVVVQRRTRLRPVFTSRRMLAVGRDGRPIDTDGIEWALQWDQIALDPAIPARLLDQRPRTNPHIQLRQVARYAPNAWEVEETWVDVLSPMLVAGECPPWLPTLLAAADGRRTGRDHLALLKEQGLTRDDASEQDFALMLFRFMSAGIIDTAESPLPR